MNAGREPEDEGRADEDRERGQRRDGPAPLPWITVVLIALCAAIYLAILREGNYEAWESLSKFGYLPVEDVWAGGYWALVTSAFVHFELWHLAFNGYWLWIFGKRLEPAIGPGWLVAFVAASAFVSSAFQMAVSEGTGIGASGVVYAMFGFMWLARDRFPGFRQVVTDSIVKLFLVWLVLCFLVTRMGLFSIGNAAHLSGLLFGAGVAGAFVLHTRRNLVRAGLAGLVALSIVPLFWCPWSVGWLCHRAYEEHDADHYERALVLYGKVIERDPGNSWAYLNRSYVHQAMGDMNAAREDFRKAREIDPTIEPAE